MYELWEDSQSFVVAKQTLHTRESLVKHKEKALGWVAGGLVGGLAGLGNPIFAVGGALGGGLLGKSLGNSIHKAKHGNWRVNKQ